MKKSDIIKAFSWYSFDQAARRLSATTDSTITKEDIIHLVTEGHIPLYWYLHLKLCGIRAGFSGSNRPSIEESLKLSWKETTPLNGPMRVSLETNPQVKTQLLSLLLSYKEKDRSYPIPVVVEDENGENWCVVEFRTQEEDDPVNKIGAGSDIMVICNEPEYTALVLRKEDIEVFESSLIAEPQKRQSDMTKEKKHAPQAGSGYGGQQIRLQPRRRTQPIHYID